MSYIPSNRKSVHSQAPLEERLLEKRHIADNGCWEFTGHIMKNGYGQIGLGKKVLLAHRASYITFVGEIAAGLYVCHKCDNRKCFNPSHLFLGTNRDNMLDMISKGRQKTLSGENSPSCKLTDQQVEEIRNRYIPFVNVQELADEFNITKQYVNQLANNLWRRNG